MSRYCREITLCLIMLLVCGAGLAAEDESEEDGEKAEQEAERVIELEKDDEVPTDFEVRGSGQGFIDTIKEFKEEMPETHTAKIYIGKGLNQNSGEYEDTLERMVMFNADGDKDGEEWRLAGETENTDVRGKVSWEEGVRDGVEKVYGRTEKGKTYVRKTRPWKDGEVDGTVEAFYPDGELMAEIPFEEGKEHGKSKTYSKEGEVKQEVSYERGKREGELIEYWPETGEKKKVVPCEDDDVHGTVRMYYEDGQLKAEMPFKEDSLHGEEIRYDEEGEEDIKRYWLKGKRVAEGVYRSRQEEKEEKEDKEDKDDKDDE